MTTPTIFLSAGEASGEHYGALLLEELRLRCASLGMEARFFGMGGERMEALGFERVVRSEDVAVMGITEVVRHLPQIYREYRKLKAAIQARQPDVAVLIDFPDIHLKLAKGFDEPVLERGAAGDSGDFLCESAALGVEEGADREGAAVCGPDAGDLSV